jgi:hypothetical protein
MYACISWLAFSRVEIFFFSGGFGILFSIVFGGSVIEMVSEIISETK